MLSAWWRELKPCFAHTVCLRRGVLAVWLVAHAIVSGQEIDTVSFGHGKPRSLADRSEFEIRAGRLTVGRRSHQSSDLAPIDDLVALEPGVARSHSHAGFGAGSHGAFEAGAVHQRAIVT